METKTALRRPGMLLVAFLVATQIAVPAWQLAARWINEGSQPAAEYPLSWQMYSGTNSGHFVGTDGAGAEIPLSTEGLPPVIRAIGYDESVPRLLCEADDNLVSVKRIDAEEAFLKIAEEVQC